MVIVTRCLTIVPTAAREGRIARPCNQVMVRFRVSVRDMVRVEIRIRAKVYQVYLSPLLRQPTNCGAHVG